MDDFMVDIVLGEGIIKIGRKDVLVFVGNLAEPANGRNPTAAELLSSSSQDRSRRLLLRGRISRIFFTSRRFIQHPAASFSELAHWLDAG